MIVAVLDQAQSPLRVPAEEQQAVEGVTASPRLAAVLQVRSPTSTRKMSPASRLWTTKPQVFVVVELRQEADLLLAAVPDSEAEEGLNAVDGVDSLQAEADSGAPEEVGETGRRYVDYCMRPGSIRSQPTSLDWPCPRVLRRDFSRLGYARGD